MIRNKAKKNNLKKSVFPITLLLTLIFSVCPNIIISIFELALLVRFLSCVKIKNKSFVYLSICLFSQEG